MAAKIEVHALPEGVAKHFRDTAGRIRTALKPQWAYCNILDQLPADQITPESFAEVRRNYVTVLRSVLEEMGTLAEIMSAIAELSDANEAMLLARWDAAEQIVLSQN